MQLSNNKKRRIKEALEQAKAAIAAGRIPVFDELCRRIEGVQPGNPDVANLRAIVRYKMGRPAEAERLFTLAIKADPKRHEFHNNLGALFLEQKRYAEAADCYGDAIKLGNKTVPVQLCYGKALVETGRFEEAATLLQQLKKQQPQNVDVLLGLYHAYYPLDRTEEARACLEDILERDPNHTEALFELGALDNQAGRFEQAETRLRASLANKPGNVDAYASLAIAKTFNSSNDADLIAMTGLYQQGSANSKDRMALCFTLGKAMEDLKDYDRAFAYFEEGNALHHKKSRYNAKKALGEMEGIMAAFTPEVFSHASGNDDASPVFIVGMPRCGSTLVEQILAAHPDVLSRGECDVFEPKALAALQSEGNLLTPEQMATLTPEQWGEVARIYLEHLKGDASKALRITDKTLTNARMVGAIHCALPNAKIVHVRRHPLDTCLSIYKHNLRSRKFDYGDDLNDLGGYYEMYLKLMQHWRKALPAGVMYELDYEHLIANQEKETRKLLEACGLTWNDRCLEFSQASNMVRTASMAQVRRSIYSDSMAAWKRYKKQLKPLIRILGKGYPKAT